MDAFIEHDQNMRLFDLFRLGEPNRNHYIIKNLALNDRLACICTTNFDLLIERAFSTEPAIAYTVTLENTEATLPLGAQASVPLIKLHGSADTVASIRSTIQSIASGTGFESRQALVRQVLTIPSSVLWVWGYSCSDVLDINPAIAAQPQGAQTTVLVHHDPAIDDIASAIITPLSELPAHHPFRTHRGHLVRVNADILAAMLVPPTYDNSASMLQPMEWHAVVHAWIASFTHRHIQDSILSHLFYNSAQYGLALKYNQRALELSRHESKRGIGAALSNRGMMLYKTGAKAEALLVFAEALEVFRDIGFSFGIATSYNNLGYVSGYSERITEGHEFLQTGLTYLEENSFREASLCKGYLLKSRGELHSLSHLYTEAERDYNTALSIFREGYKAEEAEVLMLKGKLYRATSRTDEAERLFDRAAALAADVGNLEVVAECADLMAPP